MTTEKSLKLFGEQHVVLASWLECALSVQTAMVTCNPRSVFPTLFGLPWSLGVEAHTMTFYDSVSHFVGIHDYLYWYETWPGVAK